MGCRSDCLERMISYPSDGRTSAPTKLKLHQHVALIGRCDGGQRRGTSMVFGDGLKERKGASHYGEDPKTLLNLEVLFA